MQYYYAQAMYILGDKGYEKLFPQSNERDSSAGKSTAT